MRLIIFLTIHFLYNSLTSSAIFFEIRRNFFLDMVDFVTSLHATFDRKLAELRGSVEDAVFNEHANGKEQKT